MTLKKTISFSAEPVLVNKLQEFSASVGMNRSMLLSTLIEKFLIAHEKALLVEDPENYVKLTTGQQSLFCPTHIGVMMHLCLDMDILVKEQLDGK